MKTQTKACNIYQNKTGTQSLNFIGSPEGLVRTPLYFNFGCISIFFVAFLLLSCKKNDEHSPYQKWEQISFGRGVFDIQLFKETSTGFIVANPRFYSHYNRNASYESQLRHSVGFDIAPVANHEVFVEMTSDNQISYFLLSGKINRSAPTPTIQGSQLRILFTWSPLNSPNSSSPFAISEVTTDDTCHLYYIAQNNQGNFLVDQPIFAKTYWSSGLYRYLELGLPKHTLLPQARHNAYKNPTYFNGHVYFSDKSRINVTTGTVEHIDDGNMIDQYSLYNSISDTLIGIGYRIGSDRVSLLIKYQEEGGWNQMISFNSQGTIEAIGKVGKYFVIGMSSRLGFIDLVSKKMKFLEVGNLPTDKIISGIIDDGTHMYVGYRHDLMYKKSLQDIHSELARIP